MLEHYMFEFDTAENGEHAIKQIRSFFETHERTYNLILMDYISPIYSGLHASKIIIKYLKDTAPELV